MLSEHKKQIFILMLLGIFLIPIISADLVFKQSENLDIKIVCINAGYCSSSSVCNVSVFGPEDEIILDGIQTTRASNLAFHNFSLNASQTTSLGEYRVGGFCKDGSVTQPIDFTFNVNPNGLFLSVGSSILYFLMLMGSFIIFLFSFYFSITIPWANVRNDGGKIISINSFKYLKLVLIAFSYGTFTWIMNISLGVSEYLNVTIYYGFFKMMFELFINLAWPFIITLLIISIVLIFRDSKIKEDFKRGFKPR